MAEQPVHLTVEKGPDKGRGLTIPAEGARVGRSSNNDIVLMDPAMSRFHCRFFFKPGEGLWAEDLGSANQTLLNDKPLYESRLHNGDRRSDGDNPSRDNPGQGNAGSARGGSVMFRIG